MTRSAGRTRVAAMVVAILALAGLAAAQEPELSFTPRTGVSRQPPPAGADELAVDDGSFEGTVGVGLQTASQFLWFNRFTLPAVPFRLDEVWVLFPDEVAVGSAVELVVWFDADGDPTTGADLLWRQDATVQVADDLTFSVYPVDPPVVATTAGDLLIGVVNRWVTSGVTPAVEPATLDTGASQGRSWIVRYSGDPPDPPSLPGDGAISLVDAFQAGNWLIRGYGEAGVPAPGIPDLGRWGAALMVLLVAVAARWLVAGRSA